MIRIEQDAWNVMLYHAQSAYPKECCGILAGTAEGDFATCMIWSTRPGNELPVLMVVTNNGWGVSTPAATQHGEARIADRGRPFGIPGEAVDGNDPIASWHAVRRALAYCRRERKPYLLEARVSRLHGHSSSSGAARVKEVILDPEGTLALLETPATLSGASEPEIYRAIAQMPWTGSGEMAR